MEYRAAVSEVGATVLNVLAAFEAIARALHPPALPGLRKRLAPLEDRLDRARAALAGAAPPDGLGAFHERLSQALGHAAEAVRCFRAEGGGVAEVLAALRAQCRVQEAIYPLRLAFPPFEAFFSEPGMQGRLVEPDPRGGGEPSVGVLVAGEGRGGFHLYVPEAALGDPRSARPLIVALHGGGGEGRDFLWTWLREARSRGCLLLAPTSRASTWSLDAPELDATPLRSMLDFVAERWRIDPTRVLLTGLSDGATFALLAGLAEGAPFTHLAPVSGVLHPHALAAGHLARAAGRPVYQVHGALDWLFPVALARMAKDALLRAGADLTYREIGDLSHTYPREENARILDWMGAERAA